MKQILEVEGGFIAKEYEEGSVVAQSEVVATKEEAEEAELVSVVKKDSGIGAATPEAMVDPELTERTARVEEAEVAAPETEELEPADNPEVAGEDTDVIADGEEVPASEEKEAEVDASAV